MQRRVDFGQLEVGRSYNRTELAELWGYAGPEALQRGVVTPAKTRYIILFVTREKQSGYEPYKNELKGKVLQWEGPTDHFAEDRLITAKENGDEIHLFYRDRHHSEFLYLGRVALHQATQQSQMPSKYTFQLVD